MDLAYRRLEVIGAVRIGGDSSWVAFDAAEWFRRASNGDIMALCRDGLCGPAAVAVARWCWDERSPDGEVGVGAPFGDSQEAFIEPISLVLWLLGNRALLAITEFEEVVQHVRDLVQEIRAGILHTSGNVPPVTEVKVSQVVPYFDFAVKTEKSERESVSLETIG